MSGVGRQSSRPPVGPASSVIFLYHSIIDDAAPLERSCLGQALPSRSFQRQVSWLAAAFSIVPLAEYLEEKRKSRALVRRLAALTFDDGVGSTFRRVFPFLEQKRIPATFFLSTGHLEGGRLLWFCYLNALCFENSYEEVTSEGRVFPLRTLAERIEARRVLEALARRGDDPSDFTRELESAYPLPLELREEYGGMTHAQVRAAAASHHVEIGSHTVTHPFLSRKSRGEQYEEIRESRTVLSALTDRSIRYFAYPAGDYDHETLGLLRQEGFEAGFATISRKLGPDEILELDRIGIYSAALWKVKLKAWGAVDLARRVGLRVG